jgi:hypothetical protein
MLEMQLDWNNSKTLKVYSVLGCCNLCLSPLDKLTCLVVSWYFWCCNHPFAVFSRTYLLNLLRISSSRMIHYIALRHRRIFQSSISTNAVIYSDCLICLMLYYILVVTFMKIQFFNSHYLPFIASLLWGKEGSMYDGISTYSYQKLKPKFVRFLKSVAHEKLIGYIWLSVDRINIYSTFWRILRYDLYE